MCKNVFKGLLGLSSSTPQQAATPVANSNGDTGAEVKDTSIGQGTGVNLSTGQEATGRVRLSGAGNKRVNSQVGISI